MQAHGFRVSFTPLSEVLFTFPSRYWYAIGLSVVFSLAGWSPPIQPGFLVSRHTQVPLLWSLRYAYRPLTVSGGAFHRLPLRSDQPLCGPTTPARAVTPPVWALPFSLAATRGIVLTFFSCGYLDVSVPRVRLRNDCGCGDRSPRVAPFGYLRISVYLPLPAAFRSLSRPSSPPRAQASPMRPCSFRFSFTALRLSFLSEPCSTFCPPFDLLVKLLIVFLLLSTRSGNIYTGCFQPCHCPVLIGGE